MSPTSCQTATPRSSGEALGEVVDGQLGAAEGGVFGGSQYPAREARAVAFPRRLYAGDLDDVGTDAVYHRARAACISRFISRTASCRPVKSARAMMAWPMFNSRIAGIAATGATL